jgi:3-hydroxyacyl-[acyl-carrier-protein] dehydratase
MRAFVTPGQTLIAEADLVHDGSGFAVASTRLLSNGKTVADAQIVFRTMPFPNETMRAEMLAAARRVQVPDLAPGLAQDLAHG